ncbi:hypothetical protein Poly51_02830 [Rubripirellula tenax]|uniref:Chromosome partition protein Smc n=1 Tax=Rubripirellula tenax TaxID=2528015 RepID=A0A5C6FGP3_9BACT|nr:hypothetical protein [Rubripirellula tenax]TWU60010.1 hypothetical protein Poly51_02830 [Rubripirellula tenax]
MMKLSRNVKLAAAATAAFAIPMSVTRWINADENGFRGTEQSLPADSNPGFRTETRYEEVRDTRTGTVSRVPVTVQTYRPVDNQNAIFVPARVAEASETDRLRTQYQQVSTDAEREPIRQQLVEVLEKQFDTMHAQQAESIRQTRERLETVEALHEKRTANRDAIVQRRIEDLLGAPEDLRWQVSPTPVAMQLDNYVPRTSAALSQPGFGPPPATRINPQSNPSFGQSPGYETSTIEWLPVNPPTIQGLPTLRENENPQTYDATAQLHPGRAVWPSQSGRRPASDVSAAESANRYFEIQRNLALRLSQLEVAETNLDASIQLREKGAIPPAELEKIKAEVKGLKGQIEVDERQFEWLRESGEKEIARLKQSLEKVRDEDERSKMESEIQSRERLQQMMRRDNDEVDGDREPEF